MVLYDRLGALWATNTYGRNSSVFTMQTDGHLVLYSSDAGALWWSGTVGNSGARMEVQDDCNMVIYNSVGQPIWATNTFCR